ncbi:MAG: phosphoribosylformylglycinamidine synthase subunit PurQ [Chloroflexota bacterium]
MRFGVIVFPGSNCDADAFHAIRDIMGQPVDYLWHKDGQAAGYDCLILPGGFSYGDYLRTGAIARFSPIMPALAAHAAAGKPVIGICNGFQMLLEMGLLPGAMLRNDSLQFRCQFQHLRVENERTRFTSRMQAGEVISVPIAHGEGNYYCDADMLAELEAHGQIVFRYCDADGNVTAAANPNGSLANIAGIVNRAGNILGMMPHPERCADPTLGGAGKADGARVFASLIDSWERGMAGGH